MLPGDMLHNMKQITTPYTANPFPNPALAFSCKNLTAQTHISLIYYTSRSWESPIGLSVYGLCHFGTSFMKQILALFFPIL